MTGSRVRGVAGIDLPSVGRFTDELRRHGRDFFTNWSESDLPLAPKLGLTFKNRAKSLVNGGCCGNHGQPGC